MAARCAGLRHPDLAASPCPDVLDRLTRPGVIGLHRLEEGQNVLPARGRPQSQQPMVGVREGPSAADRDEPGVAVLGKDHGPTVLDIRELTDASSLDDPDRFWPIVIEFVRSTTER